MKDFSQSNVPTISCEEDQGIVQWPVCKFLHIRVERLLDLFMLEDPFMLEGKAQLTRFY